MTTIQHLFTIVLNICPTLKNMVSAVPATSSACDNIYCFCRKITDNNLPASFHTSASQLLDIVFIMLYNTQKHKA